MEDALYAKYLIVLIVHQQKLLCVKSANLTLQQRRPQLVFSAFVKPPSKLIKMDSAHASLAMDIILKLGALNVILIIVKFVEMLIAQPVKNVSSLLNSALIILVAHVPMDKAQPVALAVLLAGLKIVHHAPTLF